MLRQFLDVVKKIKKQIEDLEIDPADIKELWDSVVLLIGVFMTKKEPLFGAAGVDSASEPVSDEERDEAIEVLVEKCGMSKSQAETTVEHLAS